MCQARESPKLRVKNVLTQSTAKSQAVLVVVDPMNSAIQPAVCRFLGGLREARKCPIRDTDALGRSRKADVIRAEKLGQHGAGTRHSSNCGRLGNWGGLAW